MAVDDPKEVRREFGAAVNMSRDELERWLETDESQSAGQGQGGDADGESVGHESGRRIVSLLAMKADDLSDDDIAHMRKVVGYVNRHLAQRPEKEEIETSRWRYSLMNWGHDPLKEGG